MGGARRLEATNLVVGSGATSEPGGVAAALGAMVAVRVEDDGGGTPLPLPLYSRRAPRLPRTDPTLVVAARWCVGWSAR
jgi:hypothetical protein